MFGGFKFGSYRIEDTELANSKKNNAKSFGLILVKFLDGSNVKFYLDVSRGGVENSQNRLKTRLHLFRRSLKAAICWTRRSTILRSQNEIILA